MCSKTEHEPPFWLVVYSATEDYIIDDPENPEIDVKFSNTDFFEKIANVHMYSGTVFPFIIPNFISGERKSVNGELVELRRIQPLHGSPWLKYIERTLRDEGGFMNQFRDTHGGVLSQRFEKDINLIDSVFEKILEAPSVHRIHCITVNAYLDRLTES